MSAGGAGVSCSLTEAAAERRGAIDARLLEDGRPLSAAVKTIRAFAAEARDWGTLRATRREFYGRLVGARVRGERREEAYTLLLLGCLYHGAGEDLNAAERLYSWSRRIFVEMKDRRHEGRAVALLADLSSDRQDFEGADALFGQAREIARVWGDYQLQNLVLAGQRRMKARIAGTLKLGAAG